MATRTSASRSRRGARTTRKGSNVTGIQKVINRDYKLLARDYGKLGLEIWRNPVTKYILGGVALTVAVPFILRRFGGYSEVEGYVREGFEGIKRRVDTALHSDDVLESVQ